jgi:micrococcal nuclease
MKRWLAVLALVLAPALHAATFHGTVTYVTDGDTLWVRSSQGGAPVELRLLDLDAPEGCQAYGPQATKALRQRLQGEAVRVRTRGKDDYGRLLAHVEHRGQDVGRWLVRSGHAWSMRYRGRGGAYSDEEAEARHERRGLWATPGAVEPRKFRKSHGRCQGRALPSAP